MSARKFRGLVCVYCSVRQAVTGDHIFARQFFVPSARANLPQVPTCDHCNNQKSRLEHYLTAVLPFGGRHPDATENLSKLVPPRLAENARLHRELEAKRGTVWSLEDGLVRQATTIPIEPERILELFQYVARALVWFHWKVYFGSEHDSEVLMLTRYGKAYFDRLFAMRAAQRITHSVGNKTFEYAGVQGVDIPQISVWRFRMYGGMVFAGDPAVPNEVSNEIGVLTGPKRITGILSKEAAHQ